VEDAVAAMSEHRVRHLGVTEDGRVAGMLSGRDVLDTLVATRGSTGWQEHLVTIHAAAAGPACPARREAGRVASPWWAEGLRTLALGGAAAALAYAVVAL